jgi:hypothetical protein
VELISYAPDTDLNPDLFSGFLSAIQDFTVEMSKKELLMFQVAESQYYIYRQREYPFYIVAKISRYFGELALKKILQEIHDKFWNEYSENLTDFQGNTTPFKNFRKTLIKYIK